CRDGACGGTSTSRYDDCSDNALADRPTDARWPMARKWNQSSAFGIQHDQPHGHRCRRLEVLSDSSSPERDLRKPATSEPVAALGGAELLRRTRDAADGPGLVGCTA